LALSNDNGLYNEIKFVFAEGMTKGLDVGFDAGKYPGNPDISFYSFMTESNSSKFEIQALPSLNEGISIPIGFNVKPTGTYKFSVHTMENFEPGTPIVLEDKVTGIQTDLSINPEYSFSIDQPGTFDNRFVLYFKSAVGISSPAPIQEPVVNFVNGELLITDVAEGKVDVRVVDITGRVVAMESFQSAEVVNMPINVQTGIYIVEVAAENGKFASKIYVK
jgi:hypothetical protein